MRALRSLWEAVGIISGTMIGAGMFALPLAVYTSGMVWALAAAALAFFAMLSIHLAYGEIVTNADGAHRLPGYTERYFGKWLGALNKVTVIVGFTVALLIYGILGGIFASTLAGWTAGGWTIVFLAIGAFVLFSSNAKEIGILNIALTVPLVAAAFYISFYAGAEGSLFNIPSFGADPFFSFGVFVFSLAGLSVIADAKEVFVSRAREEGARGLRSSIVIGTAFPMVLYFIFAFAIAGATGSATTEDAFGGLLPILGSPVIIFGAVVGLLAVFTSLIALSYDLKEMYELDMNVSPRAAWMLAGLVPIALFLVLSRDFVKLVSIVGGLFVAFDGIFVVLIARRMRALGESTIRFLHFGRFHQFALVAIFILSILYELVYQVF